MGVYAIVARPYKSRVKTGLSLFNYICLLAVMSLMLMFETGVQKSSKHTFGQVMTLILIVNFLLNMLVVILLTIIEVVKILKKCCKKEKKLLAHPRTKIEASSGKKGAHPRIRNEFLSQTGASSEHFNELVNPAG